MMAVAVPLSLLALWEVLARLAVLSPRYFPPPSRVGAVLVESFTEGDLGGETLVTLTRLALAFALAAVPAVPLGLLMGMARPVRAAMEPYIAVLFPVPKIALLPFLLILLGVGEPAFVLTGAISAFSSSARWPACRPWIRACSTSGGTTGPTACVCSVR
jgi:NitT/TauT family transport system permease protein